MLFRRGRCRWTGLRFALALAVSVGLFVAALLWHTSQLHEDITVVVSDVSSVESVNQTNISLSSTDNGAKSVAPVQTDLSGPLNGLASVNEVPPPLSSVPVFGCAIGPFTRALHGEWISRDRPEPFFHLFNLSLTMWYKPVGVPAECDFRVVEPQEACRCLRKVAFIGDSITLGLTQIFAEYVTQNEKIILRKKFDPSEGVFRAVPYAYRKPFPSSFTMTFVFASDKGDCFAAPLYDQTGHIRYKPCIFIMESNMFDESCGIHIYYLRINKWMPGKAGTEKEIRQFLTALKSAGDPTSPIDFVFLNFGLHHMVAWPARVLTNYLASVQRAVSLILDLTAPSTLLIWSGTTAQHVAKKPAEWRRLQSNERVMTYNNASFETVRQAAGSEMRRVMIWDPMPMTDNSVADSMDQPSVFGWRISSFLWGLHQ